MLPESNDYRGHRMKVLSGKVSPEVFNAVLGLIKEGKYKTKNDVVEEALIMLLENEQHKRIEEGC